MSSTSSNSSFWSGVISTVAATTILGVLGWFSQSVINSLGSEPISVIAYQSPVEIGAQLSTDLVRVRELAEAIRSAELPPPERSDYYGNLRIDQWQKNREQISRLVEFIVSDPRSIQVVSVKNNSNKVVNNLQLTADKSLKIAVRGDIQNKYNITDTNKINVDRFEPGQEISFFVWLSHDISVYRLNNLRILAGDQSVPIKYLPPHTEGIIDYIIAQLGIWTLIPVLLLFFGAFLVAIIPIFAIAQINPTFRRNQITKGEFGRMLGDVKALYSKFRPDSPTPFGNEDAA